MGFILPKPRIEGVRHYGVVNLGYRPTVAKSPERTLEIHLLDFDREIYGQDVEVRFLRYLRPEKKFDGIDALIRQIKSRRRTSPQTLRRAMTA